MEAGTAWRSAGTLGRLQAPLARTRHRQRRSPVSVATWYPSSVGRTDVTVVCVRTGAAVASAKPETNSATWALVMKPSGSAPSYRWPGSRVCQLGVRSRSEFQRSRRQELATSPRSSTTWSIERSPRHRLAASPAWPAPTTTVVTCSMTRLRYPPVLLLLTSTVTLVGLVTQSYSAERFCDCATTASMSCGDASASMLKVTLMPS